MMCLLANNKKKYEKNIFFASLKTMKKEVGSGVGSGDPDPDPQQNVTDPQHRVYHTKHCLFLTVRKDP